MTVLKQDIMKAVHLYAGALTLAKFGDYREHYVIVATEAEVNEAFVQLVAEGSLIIKDLSQAPDDRVYLFNPRLTQN